MKLDKKAFALTCGIVWGVSVSIATIWLLVIGSSGMIMSKLSNFYFGYSVSYIGALVGLVWGFIDGLIGGFIFAALYNAIACKHKEGTEGK